jgi:hypothetical protein
MTPVRNFKNETDLMNFLEFGSGSGKVVDRSH